MAKPPQLGNTSSYLLMNLLTMLQVLDIQTLAILVVPRAGIEPARTLLSKGFSHCYGFHHRLIAVRSPDYSFTLEIIH